MSLYADILDDVIRRGAASSSPRLLSAPVPMARVPLAAGKSGVDSGRGKSWTDPVSGRAHVGAPRGGQVLSLPAPAVPVPAPAPAPVRARAATMPAAPAPAPAGRAWVDPGSGRAHVGAPRGGQGLSLPAPAAPAVRVTNDDTNVTGRMTWLDQGSGRARIGTPRGGQLLTLPDVSRLDWLRREINELETVNKKVTDDINAVVNDSGARGMSRAAGMGAYNRGERFPQTDTVNLQRLTSQRMANQSQLDELWDELSKLESSGSSWPAVRRTQVNDEISGNWNRWLYLASVGRVLTNRERAEAGTAVKLLDGVVDSVAAQALHSEDALKLLYDYKAIRGALSAKSSGFNTMVAGALKSVPFLARGFDAANKWNLSDERASHLSADVRAALSGNNNFRGALAADPKLAAVGEVLGNVGLTLGVSAAIKGVSIGAQLPKWVLSGVKSAFTFGTIGTLRGADEGTAEYGLSLKAAGHALKRGAVDAAGGFVGGAASYVTSFLCGAALQKLGLLNNGLAQAVVRGLSGTAFAGGTTGVNELARFLEYPKGYVFDGERVEKDMLTAFAYSSLSALISQGVDEGMLRGANRVAGERVSVSAGGAGSGARPESEFPGLRNAEDLDALRIERNRLAKLFHSDVVRGDDSVMKRVSYEFDIQKAWLLNNSMSRGAQAYRTATTSTGDVQARAAEEFMRESRVIDMAVRSGDIVGQYADNAAEILRVMSSDVANAVAGSVSTRFSVGGKDVSSPEQIVTEYAQAVDESVKSKFEKYYEGNNAGFERIPISKVSQRQADDATRLLKGSYTGYSNNINSNGIIHIRDEHGPNGRTDHSMKDVNDLARMAYILDNYDDVEIASYSSGDVKTSKEFRNSYDEPAPMLKYTKRINGTYYVVMAIPESKFKKFWVVSAYKENANTGNGTQAPNAYSLGNTPYASLASSSPDIVDQMLPQNDMSVNRGGFDEDVKLTPEQQPFYEALRAAKDMAAYGESPSRVYEATGWMQLGSNWVFNSYENLLPNGESADIILAKEAFDHGNKRGLDLGRGTTQQRQAETWRDTASAGGDRGDGGAAIEAQAKIAWEGLGAYNRSRIADAIDSSLNFANDEVDAFLRTHNEDVSKLAEQIYTDYTFGRVVGEKWANIINDIDSVFSVFDEINAIGGFDGVGQNERAGGLILGGDTGESGGVGEPRSSVGGRNAGGWSVGADSSGERFGGLYSPSAGEQVGGLEGRSEGGPGRNVQAGFADDRQYRFERLWAEGKVTGFSGADVGLVGAPDGNMVWDVPRDLFDGELSDVHGELSRAGLNARFFLGRLYVNDSDFVNGMIVGRDVYIQVDDPYVSVRQIAKHELFHDFAKLHPGVLWSAEQKIVSMFSREEFESLVRLYSSKYNGVYKETGEALAKIVKEEIFADAHAGINAFGGDASKYKSVVDEAMREVVSAPGAPIGETADATARTTGPPVARFAVLGSAPGDTPTADTHGGSDSDSKRFKKDFDDWVTEGKPDRKRLTIGRTSKALQSIGVEFKSIEWDTTKINTIQQKHLGMSDGVLKQVPEIIGNPIIVMESKTQPNRLTMLGEVYNDNGLPVIAVLELLPMHRDGVSVLDVIKVVSTYARDNTNPNAGIGDTQVLINTSDILYIDPNENRTNAWLTRNQLQLPFGVNQYGPIGKITYIRRDVKGNFSSFSPDYEQLPKWKRDLLELNDSDKPRFSLGGRVYGPEDVPARDVDAARDGSFAQEIQKQVMGRGGSGVRAVGAEDPGYMDALVRTASGTGAGDADAYMDGLMRSGSVPVNRRFDDYMDALAQTEPSGRERQPVAGDDRLVLGGTAAGLGAGSGPVGASVGIKGTGGAVGIGTGKAGSGADGLVAPGLSDVDVPSRKELSRGEREGERALKKKLIDSFSVQPGDRARVRSVLDAFTAKLRERGDGYAEMLYPTFEALFDAGKVRAEVTPDFVEAARELKGRRIYASPEVKAEFVDDWERIRKRALGFGVYFTGNKNDLGLDSVLHELGGMFPGVFDVTAIDPADMVDNLMRVIEGAKGEVISLEQEARIYGGDEAVADFKRQMFSEFLSAVGDFHTAVHGARTGRVSEIERVRAENDALLREYGVVVRKHVEARANLAAEDRFATPSKEEFRGTLGIAGFDVLIEGARGNYDIADALLSNQKAAKRIKRAVREAERRLRPTPQEKAFANAVVDGSFSIESVPTSMDAGKIAELVDYYWALRGSPESLLRRQRQDINGVLDEQMAGLFEDSDAFSPYSLLKLNYRTAERNVFGIFGESRGRQINEAVFWPVDANEAERFRFKNHLFDRVRSFAGSFDGHGKLNKTERAAVQLVIEGRAAAEAVAGMEMSQAIKNAAVNIKKRAKFSMRKSALMVGVEDYKGVVLDAAREFSLQGDEKGLAEKYARWLWTSDLLAGDGVDAVKVDNAVKVYSGLFDEFYDLVNRFLVVHGYEPIGFVKGYAPHLQPEGTFSLLSGALERLGLNTDVTRLPSNIAGLTAEYKPNKRWNPYFLQRMGDVTQYDIVSAFESYVDYMSDVLYHTDDIMRVRAAVKYFRKTYAPEEIQANLEWADTLRYAKPEEKMQFLRDAKVIRKGDTLGAATVSRLMDDYVDKLYADIKKTGKYSDFVQWLDNYANILAGKQSAADRGGESHFGRAGLLNFGNLVVRTFSRAQVAGNLSSALNQVAQIPMIQAELGYKFSALAVADVISGEARGKTDWARQSDFLTGKRGVEYIAVDPGEMVVSALFKPAEFVDSLVSTVAVRGMYLKQVAEGKSHAEALALADRFGRGVMGSRMKGSKPVAFHAKNPFLQMLHVFQIEALNSWDHLASDLPRDFKDIERSQGRGAAVASLAGVIVKMLISAFLLNRLAEELYGGTPAPFDLLGLSANFVASGERLSTNEWLRTVIDNGWEKLFGERLFGTDAARDEEFDWGAAASDLNWNLSNEVPFLRNASALMGVGDSSLPLPNVFGKGGWFSNLNTSLFGENGVSWPELGWAVLGIGSDVLPGGRQLFKSAQGAETLVRGGRYRGYGDKARLQYPVGDDFWSVVRGALFGNSGFPETRDFYASGMSGLSVGQTELFDSLVDDGVDSKELYSVIQEWRRVGNDKDAEPDSAERGRLQRDVIRGLDGSDAQKLKLFRGLSGADSRADHFGALLAAGLSWDEVMDAYDKYLVFNRNKEFNASRRASEFARWVDERGVSRDQAAAVKGELRYWQSIPAEASRYEAFVEAGLTGEQALELSNRFAALEPIEGHSGVTDLQRYRVIAGADLTEGEKIAAIGTVMGSEMLTEGGKPSQFARMLELTRAGLSVGRYVDARGAFAKIGDRNLTAAEKATEFSRWVNSQRFKPELAELLRGSFTFFQQIPAEAGRYDKFMGVGLPEKVSYDLSRALMALKPLEGREQVSDLQRFRAVVDTVSGVGNQLAALSTVMDEAAFLKFSTGNLFGISPGVFVSFRELVIEADRSNPDPAKRNESIDQDEARRAISRLPGLSNAQRAVLFQLQNKAWKVNPYSSLVGARVREELERGSVALAATGGGAPQPGSGAPQPGSGASRGGAPQPGSGASRGGAPQPGSGASGGGAPQPGSGVSGGGAPQPGSGVSGGGAPQPGSGVSGGGAPQPGSGASRGGAPLPGSGLRLPDLP